MADEGSKRPLANVAQTLIAVADTGSTGSAAKRLGMSEAVVIERMQQALGAPLFIRSEDQRSALTEIGQHILRLARSRLDDHHRLSVVSSSSGGPIRLGVGSVFIDKYVRHADMAGQNVSLTSAVCFELAQNFADGRLDVVYVLDVRDNRQKLGKHLVAEHKLPLSWVKMPGLKISLDQPVPMATYPGDRSALNALNDAGREFQVMFSSPEYLSKLSAVRSGRFLTAIPRNQIESPLIEDIEDDLPKIPAASVLVAVRGDRNSARFKPILASLASLHA